MPKPIEIVLGGRTFAVSQLPIRADAKWRDSVRDLVDPIADMAIASNLASPTPDRLVKLAFGSALIVDPGRVLDAILDYSAELRAETQWIEENAYADEALTALLLLFFGTTSMASGSPAKPAETTSKS